MRAGNKINMKQKGGNWMKAGSHPVRTFPLKGCFSISF